MFRFITAEEAASYIKDGDNVGFSGFTPAGAPKAISLAISEKAKSEHSEGRTFKIGIITGASAGDSLDGALSRADAVKFRTPYQTNKDLRNLINAGKTAYFDLHLSEVAQNLRYGFIGKVNWAVIEASDVTENGEIILTSSVGISPTICHLADRIFIELNKKHPASLRGVHDIYEPSDPPHRREIPIYKCSDKIGKEYIKVDPSKIVGIVETNFDDEAREFAETDAITEKIGQNVANFLVSEIRNGSIPSAFLPIQSGVGNIANAVLGAMGSNPDIPVFEMYTEVLQNSVVELMMKGRIKFASCCSMTVTPDILQDVYSNLDFFRDKLIMRPSEISNSPEVARRLGIISINTALEVDLFGHVNSTQVMGCKMMNGIGGSGDFTRNSYISIFTCPSVAKKGAISAIVPMVTHMDHSEHSVQVVITENGIADLRAKSPMEKAVTLIENCVNEDYKQQLYDYIKVSDETHTPQTLRAAFAMHIKYQSDGDMRNVNWNEFNK